MSDQFPSLWRTVELRQIASFVSGGTPSRKDKKYFTGTIPWLTGYDLPEDRIVEIYEGRELITEEAVRESATTPVEVGTVLLTTRVTVGKVAIAQTKLCFSQDVTGIIIENTNVITPEFLAYYLLATRELLLRRNRGSTIQGVIRRDVERLQIPIPPISEQQRIVEILRQAEELRHLRRQADELIRDFQMSLFYKMFGDPENNPKRWEFTKLGDLLLDTPQNGLYKHSSYYGQGCPIVRIGDFYEGLLNKPSTFSRLSVSPQELEKYRLVNGNILINRVNSEEYLGKSALVEGLIEPTVYESNMMRLNIDATKISSRFLVVFLNTPYAKKQILRRAKRAVNQASINQQDVIQLPIYLPTLKRIEEFDEAIRTELEIKLLRENISYEFEKLYQSLINQAFLGNLIPAWSEANTARLQDEAVKRDIALGLRTKEPWLKDLRRGQVTQAEREHLEQALREIFQPAVKQLLDSLSPVVEVITQGPMLRLSELVTHSLPIFKDLVDASLASQINALNEAARNALAATVQPIVEIQQRLTEQITVQQRDLYNIAETMARLAAEIARRPDESHPRYHVLRALSDEQYWIYLAIRQQTGYFTAQSLSDEEEFPLESVRRTLPLFESLGLIMRVSVAMSPNSEDLYFIDAYRKPTDTDDSRSSAIETLRKFTNKSPGMSPPS